MSRQTIAVSVKASKLTARALAYVVAAVGSNIFACILGSSSGGLTLKIPTGSCGAIGVRALSTSGRIREVLSAIPGLEIDRTTNWNRRYRENLNRLKSGDLLEVARVIKGLMWRDREKGLSNGERKMLHSAKQILVSEVVLVEGHTYPDAEQRIEQAMMTGAKNE